MEKFTKAVGISVLVVAGTFSLAMFLAFPTKWAWNYTMPHLFHLPTINVWQAWCLNYLGNAFFKTSVSKDSK